MRRLSLLTALLATVLGNAPTFAASIVGSRHDIGLAGPAHLCEFCHTPVPLERVAAPLWSRPGGSPTFTVYGVPGGPQDDDLQAIPPRWAGGATRLCLSCHDGLHAAGVLYSAGALYESRHHPADRSAGDAASGFLPPVRGSSRIDGHPVFVTYPSQPLPLDFHVPPLPDAKGGAAGDLKLVGGMVECVSCHNVHDPTFRPFLRRSNAGSAMCLSCHKK